MERTIVNATEADRAEVLALYKSMIGYEGCPWTDHYPDNQEITYDLSRDSLFIMKDETGRIIAAISVDHDEEVNALEYWTKELAPGGELSRLAVARDMQNQGIAREMLRFGMQVLKQRGFKSIHFLVNRHNIKAVRSYDHLHFNNVGECCMFEQDFWCYEQEL